MQDLIAHFRHRESCIQRLHFIALMRSNQLDKVPYIKLRETNPLRKEYLYHPYIPSIPDLDRIFHFVSHIVYALRYNLLLTHVLTRESPLQDFEKELKRINKSSDIFDISRKAKAYYLDAFQSFMLMGSNPLFNHSELRDT